MEAKSRIETTGRWLEEAPGASSPALMLCLIRMTASCFTVLLRYVMHITNQGSILGEAPTTGGSDVGYAQSTVSQTRCQSNPDALSTTLPDIHLEAPCSHRAKASYVGALESLPHIGSENVYLQRPRPARSDGCQSMPVTNQKFTCTTDRRCLTDG